MSGGGATDLSAEDLELMAFLLGKAGIESSGPEAIRPRAPGTRIPLTFSQKRIWFLEQLEPGAHIYNELAGMRLVGELDGAAMDAAVRGVVERHESLRTVFVEEAGEPEQVVQGGHPVRLELRDLSHLPEEDRPAEVRRAADEVTYLPFDLVRGPLLRPTLLRLGARDHVLLLSLHHAVFDGWSWGVLWRELVALYNAARQGRPPALPPVALQYGDFAVWQQEHLAGGALERQTEYWKARLRGAPTLIGLPTDRPRPAEQTYRGDSSEFVVPEEPAARLSAIAQGEGATLFMALVAVLAALLGRYAGEDDVVIGSPIANRTRPELEGVVGLFANTLAVRTDLLGDPTFRELLGRVRDAVFDDFANQDLPFEKIVEELRTERSLSYNPVYQVLFSLQNVARADGGLDGLDFHPLEASHRRSKLDLALTLVERERGMRGVWEYSTELFDRDTIVRLSDHFLVLLAAAVAEPDRPLADLPLVRPEERTRLLRTWSAGGPAGEDPRPVHLLVDEQAERTPHAVAVALAGETLTYGELGRRGRALAHHLRGRGVGPETRVGVYLDRSPELLVALLGVLGAGGAYVPLDPQSPRDRLAQLAEDAGIAVLLTRERLFAELPGSVAAEAVFLDADRERIEAEPAAAPEAPVFPESAAYVIYTSGSTGKPKGVVVPHGALAGFTAAARGAYGIGPADRVLQFASVAFDASAEEIWPTLASGARLVLRTEEMLGSARLFLEACREWGITVLDLPTAYWHELVAELSEEAGADLPAALRLVIIGGERALPERLRAWRERFGARVRLVNTYGPTEATVVATLCDLQEAEDDPSSAPRHVAIGRALGHARAYVLDPRGEPAPVGVPGELYLGGGGVARGYLGDPSRTAGAFVPDPFTGVAGARLYRSGDRVRWRAEGTLEFIGRVDQQVKIRGFRVEPGEVEAVLSRQPGVEDAAVVAREDAPGQPRLVAYVVLAEPAPPVSVLRAALKAELPPYMVPAAWVVLDALPLTPGGKTDRRALPAPDWGAEGEHVAPRTATEEVLAGIWEEVLELERVGAHDNFFERGGHSLLATRVVSRVASSLGAELPLRTVFEAQTVAELAARIDAARRAGEDAAPPPIAAVDRSGPLPLSFAQERLWFLHQMDPQGSGYNMPFPNRVLGPLDPRALERALGALVLRHESLRTTFRPVDGGAVQVVGPPARARVPLADLSGLAPEARDREARRLAEEDAGRPFDLRHGPLLRLALLRLGGEEHVMLLCMHHIVSDGWSMGVLYRELYALYAASARGEAPRLPALGVQYGDFAVWQRGWLAGDVLRRQLDWWRERLAGAPPALELPVDRPRSAVATDRGASVLLRVGADEVRALRAVARREGATLYMVLRAATDVLLARWSGQEDLVVGSPIANRTRVEVEGLIGFFVNTLALRTDVSGDPAFRELVGRVRDTALGAYAHQDLPFERLVEEISPERSLSHTPLFQFMFALQNNQDDAVPAPPGLRVERFHSAPHTSRFDLELDLFEKGEELAGGVRFRTDLFDPSTVERFVAQLRVLLASAGASPEESVSRLHLLPEEEVRVLRSYGSGPAHETAPGETVPRLLAEQAARTPDAVAVLSGGEALSYARLDRRAARLARRLRGRGVRAGAPVAVCVERGPGLLVALLAVWKAGGVYLPLDPGHPPERLAFLLRDSGARLAVSEPHLALPEFGGEIVRVDAASGRDGGEDGDALPDSPSPDDLAYLIYTSGSTGAPKAVAVEHARLAHTLRGSLGLLGFAPGDVVAALASVAFDISLLEQLAPLLGGAAVRIVPREVARDPAELVRVCANATVLHAVPALMRQVVEAARGGGGLPAMRLLLVGGDTVPPDLLEELREAFPGAAARVLYGPTEATIICATYGVPERGGIAGHPLGRPLPGVRLQVRGARGELLPLGVPGELWISGGGVARGYLDRPELTAEKFVAMGGERAYRAGDRARWRMDGVLEFLGRTDEQVKVRGFRIEPGEVEAALLGEPGVREAVVLAREDRPGEKRLVAYVVPESADRAARGAGAAEQVSGWTTVFDETYGQGEAEGDPTLDLTGWNSSYTGEPIPREEMREWVERTVERILALGPRRVLEIGCGTGLLLLRLAPHVREYHGTDFSAVALGRVRRHLGALPRVTLAEHEADDLAAYAGGGYDTVVVNSVAQYFPGVDYLLRVLEGAAAALAPGGRIFVGDVRSLPLLAAFHASVELARAPEELPLAQLRERVRRAVAEEQELVVDPAFFGALRARLPRLGRVEVQVKRGGYDNEVSRFRYDVVLHLDAAPAGAPPAVRSWSGEDEAGVRALLGTSAAALLLRGVPDPGTREHARAAALLAGPAATVDEVRAGAAGGAAGVPREALFALGDASGRIVEVRPGAPGTLDVLLHPAGGAAALPAEEPAEERPWESYANDPQWGRRIRALAPALRSALRARLPEYMLPSALVVLESLPVTPNGKVDRQALPAPDTAGSRDQAYAAPRSALEEALVGIWQEVLGVERVGIHDSFFDLGGHSLLATQLVARIGVLRVEVPVRQVFQTPTVAGLAESVTRNETTPGAAEMIARVLLKLKTMSAGERAAALRAKQTPVGT